MVDRAVEKEDMALLLEMADSDNVRLSILAQCGMLRVCAERSIRVNIKAGRLTEEEADQLRQGKFL